MIIHFDSLMNFIDSQKSNSCFCTFRVVIAYEQKIKQLLIDQWPPKINKQNRNYTFLYI